MSFPQVQPFLLHSNTKRAILGKSLRITLPGPLKIFSACATSLSPSRGCAVSPGRTQAFTDRKDKRNACTHEICLVKFPARNSAQSGSFRVQGPYTGSCGKSRVLWPSTPSPKPTWNPYPELFLISLCLSCPDNYSDLTAWPALKELRMKNSPTDPVTVPAVAAMVS